MKVKYADWRQGKDATRVGDPPRLRFTQRLPRTPKDDPDGKPWCEACAEDFQDECYCSGCKGADPSARGRHYGCYCYLNRQMAGLA